MDKVTEILITSCVAGLIAFIFNVMLRTHWENIYHKDIEKLKSDLSILKDKQSFKFNKLHEKRFLVYEKLFQLLNKYYYDLHLFAHPGMVSDSVNTYEKQRQYRFENCDKSKNDFILFFLNNKIYFDSPLLEKIDKFKNLTDEIFGQNFTYYFMEASMKEYNQTRKDISEYSMDSYKSFAVVQGEVKFLLDEIENALRIQLN